MNCTVIQRRLLAAEHPEQPPPEIQSHLAQCPVCRLWLRRLIQMERLIAELPVPASTTKQQFLEGIKEPGGSRAQHALVHPSTFLLHPFKKERGLRKLSVAFTLAASLLLFALAWWSWPHNPVLPPPDISRTEQAKLDQRLSNSLRVDATKERVLRLARLAEELHGEARELIGSSERLEQWSRFYSRVIAVHLIEEARQLTAEDRKAVLADIALRLANAESEATRLATQCKAADPRSAAAFQQIALASQKGERELRGLMKG
ncbi:MAG TPA: hypothetical protein VMG10_07795 [Gemmataceae bacterium]|nr:hypothetical protein [Gemmataceae bacterium]